VVRASQTIVFAIAALGALGCGGGRGPSGVGDGGGSGPGGLSGTWEVTWADPAPRTGIVEARNGYLRVQFGEWTVRFEEQATGPATTAYRRSIPADIATTHARAPLASGQIPLALGGDWTFHGMRGDTCSANVGATSIDMSCAGVYGLPRPFPQLDGTATATRTAHETSIFGDLGGQWHVTPSRGSCDALLAGSTVTLNCRSTDIHGDMVITFGDGVASGRIGSSLEFAARRL